MGVTTDEDELDRLSRELGRRRFDAEARRLFTDAREPCLFPPVGADGEVRVYALSCPCPLHSVRS